jgi:two-component sensor histidine kinase
MSRRLAGARQLSMPTGRVRFSSYSVRTLLIIFGAAITAPLLVLLSVLLYWSASGERDRLEGRLLQVANELADDLDRDIDRNIALLQTLATSPLITGADWSGFYQQAKAALGDRAYLVLVDASGRQLVNTFVPYGQEPVFTGDFDTLRGVIQSRQPVVSNLFASLVVKKPVFNISIPVVRGDEVRYVMSLGLLPEDLLRLLTVQEADWVLAVWDRNDVIVARSREHQRFVGQKLPERNQRAPAGIANSINLEGEAVRRAVVASRLSGWRLSVSVPRASAEAPLRSTLLLLGAATLTCLLMACALGYLAARIVAKPLVSAAAAARAFGGGEPGRLPSSIVSEVNDLVAALTESGARQRLLSGELAHRCKNILAVVQTVVMRSLAGERLAADAGPEISRRLQSLARANDLLLAREWRGASLREVVQSELEAFGDRVVMSGPDVIVRPNLIQPFMLVIHELATNASKYGALSDPRGRVALTWQVAAQTLTIEWTERHGPAVQQPSKEGFGSRVLKQAVPDADARLTFREDGFAYRLEVPLSQLESEERIFRSGRASSL